MPCRIPGIRERLGPPRLSVGLHFLAVAMLSVSLVGCGEGPPRKKVLLIGVDGVRVDILAEAATPNLDSLIAGGTFSDAAQTALPTVSGPDWSSMLIGVWPAKHRVHGNNFTGNDYATYPDFLTRLEQVDSTFRTFAVVDWPPLGSTSSGGPLIGDAVDLLILFDGEAAGYRVGDSLSVAAAAEYLSTGDPDAAFVYLGNPDVVGHATSSLTPEYRASIEAADAQVGELLAALRRRSTYENEDWLILVSTDHGRTDDGGHGGDSPQERTVFYLASGPSALSGVPEGTPDVVDVAVTALAHLGVAIDSSWGLDGQVAGLATER
jgi:hypothetical protein